MSMAAVWLSETWLGPAEMPKTLRGPWTSGKRKTVSSSLLFVYKEKQKRLKINVLPEVGPQLWWSDSKRLSHGRQLGTCEQGGWSWSCAVQMPKGSGIAPKGVSSMYGTLSPKLSVFPHGLWGRGWGPGCRGERWASSSQSTRENMQYFSVLFLIVSWFLPLDFFSPSQASLYTHRHIYVYMYVYICICSTYERIKNWGGGESCLLHLTWFSLVLPVFLNMVPFYSLL